MDPSLSRLISSRLPCQGWPLDLVKVGLVQVWTVRVPRSKVGVGQGEESKESVLSKVGVRKLALVYLTSECRQALVHLAKPLSLVKPFLASVKTSPCLFSMPLSSSIT